jgi:hypothetical protein
MSANPNTPPSYHNIFSYFNFVSRNFLIKNIYTMETHNDTLNVLTNTSQALTESWTKGSASGALAGDWSTYPIDNDAQNFVNFVFGENNYDGDTNAKPPHGQPMTKYPISDYSVSVVQYLMGLVAKYYNSDPMKDSAAAISSAVNSMVSIVNSQSTNEQQLGQNEVKTEGSVVQGDTSTQQTIANMADSFQGVFANLSSLVQQMYS